MGILSNSKIITGIKPKERPTYNGGSFNPKKPLSEHNFPLTKYVWYQIYGYKKDPYTGIKRPYWMEKKVPTGTQLTPRMCGLDGFFDVKFQKQVI